LAVAVVEEMVMVVMVVQAEALAQTTQILLEELVFQEKVLEAVIIQELSAAVVEAAAALAEQA
jgi:hexokinase